MSKRQSKFSDAITAKFPSIIKGRSIFEAYCKICRINFSVAHGGVNDATKHVSTGKHKKAITAQDTSNKMTSFVISTTSNESKLVAAAEGTFAFHTAKHHMSYNSTSCTSKLYTKIFNDSKFATKISSAKTKTEAIVNNVLAPHTLQLFKETLKDIQFIGIRTDASNRKYHKLFPVVVQYFEKNNGLQTKLIEFNELLNETSDTISQYLFEIISNFEMMDKVIAFGGDNTNTNFGGVNRKEGKNIFSHLKRLLGNSNLLGIGCPAHILHNTVQAAADNLTVDVEVIVLKIFSHFTIYTVRVQSLKEFCDFVNVNYHDLLSHCKTRWLSLFPALERILLMFEGLKSYFLSTENVPKVVKSFFENSISETYFWFLHSLMHLFHQNIIKIEKEKISVVEVVNILTQVQSTLQSRLSEHFLSIKVKSLLSQIDNDANVTRFHDEVDQFYRISIQYLDKWLTHFEDIKTFQWITIDQCPSWDTVEETVKFLEKQKCFINDNILFDQFVFLKKYINENANSSEYINCSVNERWMNFFKFCVTYEQYSELLKIAEFYFSIPSHNANVERIFSLMNTQWTEERNRLKISSIKAILLLQYNFKDMSCNEFHDYLLQQNQLLSQISRSEKYDWFKKPQ